MDGSHKEGGQKLGRGHCPHKASPNRPYKKGIRFLVSIGVFLCGSHTDYPCGIRSVRGDSLSPIPIRDYILKWMPFWECRL